MMSYEEFKDMLKLHTRKYLPEELKSWNIFIYPEKDVNRSRDKICFLNPNAPASPQLYIDELYDRYLELQDFEEAVAPILQTLDMIAEEGQYMGDIIHAKIGKDKIVSQLVNTEQNKELLKDMPHRKWKEFSVVYRCILAIDREGRVLASLPISKSIARQMDLTEVELYAIAMENMREHYPVHIERMDKLICRFHDQSVFSEKDLEKARRWYIITNSLGWHGATSILDSERLHRLAMEVGSDLYLMPTSTHEFTAISAEDFDLGRNRNYTRENNLESIKLEDRISNDIYFYDREKREISIIVKSPYRTLD